MITLATVDKRGFPIERLGMFDTLDQASEYALEIVRAYPVAIAGSNGLRRVLYVRRTLFSIVVTSAAVRVFPITKRYKRRAKRV